MGERDLGWGGFDEWTTPKADGALSDTEKCFARCFAGKDGEEVVSWLRQMTMARALGPEARDAELRHLEGQRYLVAQICALIARGRAGQG